MKKIFLALAVPAMSVMLSTANASEIYKADGTSLDIHGYLQSVLYHGGQSTYKKVDGINSTGNLSMYSHFGIFGETRVNDKVSVFSDSNWNVASQTSDGSRFYPLRIYLGADFGDNGVVTVGQLYNPIYTAIVRPTDLFDQWPKEAQLNILGHSNQSSQIDYATKVGRFDLETSVQFRNKDGVNIGGIQKGTVLDNAYTGALVYHTKIGLNLRAAYARQNFGSTVNKQTGAVIPTTATTLGMSDGKVDTYGLGANYNYHKLYLAFAYLGSTTDTGQATKNKLHINSYDLVGAYNIDQYRLYTSYAIQHRNGNEIPEAYTPIRCFKVGVKYAITSNSMAWLEYSGNHGDVDQNHAFDDYTMGYGKNEVSLSAKYVL